ncbi:MAG: hypothetical protein A2Y61_07940 [Chloroflexi bacterium RBG_13_60_13]|nr:MAG: hypothetical protein A2Y61_07940 [Chloroflexi bacterium RBG_13_60_13]
MELEEFLRDWDIGESELRRVSWRRQYRDLLLRIDLVRDRRRPADPTDPLGFLHSVTGDLIFVACARVCFDKSLYYVDSDIRWGVAARTIIAIAEDETRWSDREDLTDGQLKHYALELDDRWPGEHRSWLHVVCRDLAFNVIGPTGP